MRPGGIEHHRRVDAIAAFQGNAANLVAVTPYIDHAGVVPEIAAGNLGGAHDVMRGQLRIGNIARGVEQHRAR